MTAALFFDALVVGAIIAAVADAIVIYLRPDFLRFTQRIVCEPGSSMQIRMVRFTYRPKHGGLSVVCRGPEGDRNVLVRAAFWFWLMLMVPSLLIALGALMLLTT